MKGLIDLITALILLISVSPILIIAAILIMLTMPGPVLFNQTRIGRYGKPFTIHKLRTMKAHQMNSSVTSLNDVRITPLGHLMRRSKIDELPQLFNILKGDMSIVGPRPDVPGYADKLKGADRLILSVRPGLTGAASLIYNNEEVLLSKQKDPQYFNDHSLYPDKVRIDSAYIRNQSFWLDLKIMLFTLLGKRLTEDWAQPAIETT